MGIWGSLGRVAGAVTGGMVGGPLGIKLGGDVGEKLGNGQLQSKDQQTAQQSGSSTTNVTRKATPVRVKLRSGATVTMYSYGPESQTTNSTGTTTQSGSHDPGLLEMAGTGMQLVGLGAGMSKKYGTPKAATGLVGEPVAAPKINFPDYDLGQYLR